MKSVLFYLPFVGAIVALVSEGVFTASVNVFV